MYRECELTCESSSIWSSTIFRSRYLPEEAHFGYTVRLLSLPPLASMIIKHTNTDRWYGYDYPCQENLETITASSYCTIDLVPFRGVNCSDAAGRERTFADIQNVQSTDPTASEVRFDTSTDTPFFHYVDSKTSKVHQIWFDDANSSTLKYNVALDLGVRGVGPFTYSDLDYSNERALTQATAMWDALSSYKKSAEAANFF